MLVRATRDGDQFHYLWAARRALQLLTHQTGLVAITIEGASTSELKTGGTVEDGEQLIDVAEYFGSTIIEDATLVRYVQLKHSTLRTHDVWQPSGLEKTMEGFANRYSALHQELPAEHLDGKLEFWFVTNRPISTDFVETVEDAAAQREPRHSHELSKLKKFTSLDGAELAAFCKMLRFEGGEDDYWTQRNILSHEVRGYLPELDVDAPTRLKELVTRKALSESAANPTITKMDVLRALQVNENDLFPAPSLIESVKDLVPREQESALINSIVTASGRPVIVNADAGVGKSIFSMRIAAGLPAGSVSILYDCFGNGQYRSASRYRHRHRTALVQIANELSALGLCHPLIPTASSDTSAYMSAFMHRITQSTSVLRARNANALLCIVVDAADNAQMAAEEINEPRSFVRDLLRELLPEGVRIVALCRPHRSSMLDPPPHTLSLELEPFNRAETAVHLRRRFSEATEHDIDEFHRLSSHNPRVQALALSRDASLAQILRLLGPNPTTVESTIGAILESSIEKLRDSVGPIERASVDLICSGLAVLRPLIPIPVLAAISGVDRAAIKSFALDLGRPLVVNGDTIQFFDEPAETWFQERFRPDAASINGFVERLKQFTSSSTYASAVLPQLMLEAGQLSELVELALTSSGLPQASPVERRDIELQRLQFALKAALRMRRYSDAAKLALKAGGESAGDERQQTLLRDNTDLAATFMDSNGVQELVSRRTFGSGWLGSHHAYEAAILSGRAELIGEARSRLRMAEEWLRNWSELTPKERERERVSDEDRAVMAMAHFNIHGANAAAHSLRVWSPRELSYRAGRILARRFLDHGRDRELDALAIAAGNDLGLLLAIAVETRNLHLLPPKEATERAFKLLSDRRVAVEDAGIDEPALSAVTAMIEAAYRHSICNTTERKELLGRYLPETPPHGLSSYYSGMRASHMRAYALRAALDGVQLEISDLAHPELRKKLESTQQHGGSQDVQEFRRDIGALLPWYDLWARVFLGSVPKLKLAEAIATAKTVSDKAEGILYREQSTTSDEVANVWIDILLEHGGTDKAAFLAILEWSRTRGRRLFTPTLNRLTRLAARTTGCEDLAFEFAQTAFSLLRDERSDAQNKAEGYVDVARSILTLSASEGEAYFNQAVEVASKIGDENLARWDALIDLAERASTIDRPSPQVAYNFARCAEVTWDYVDRDKHFAWSATVKALTGLCPSSSIAIISRWRDRRFGDDGRVLALAVESLVERGALSPLDAISFVAFRAQWDEDRLINAALPLCSGKEAKAAVLQLVYRYMRLEAQSAKKLKGLERIAASTGIDLQGLENSIAHAVARENALENARSHSYDTRAASTEEERCWDDVFTGFDLTSATGLYGAYQRFQEGEPPLSTEEFLRNAIQRIRIGREAEFVTAFGTIADFDLYHLRAFLDVFPSEWKGRLGVRSAFAAVLKDFCRRFCMSVRRSRYYEPIPLTVACEISGIKEGELLEVILASIGESSEAAGPNQLFSLVSLLSDKLAQDEALQVLSYGLDLFQMVLEDKDGDGPWTPQLSPPADLEDALAGYVWAALASPVAATRWEAAHVVVAFCAMRRSGVLSKLISHARAATAAPFADTRFAFFTLHSRLWLMIAAARAATEYGTALVPLATYFLEHAHQNEPHVLIRLFAARTLLALGGKGLVSLEEELRTKLEGINLSPFKIVSVDRTHEGEHDKTGTSDDDIPEQDRYFFGIDFGPYWLAPLGRCFGMSETDIEYQALKAIRSDLGYRGTHRWDEDERARRRLYRYEATQHSHGSYPRVDNHAFYLSYHAMFVTAGRLLASKPLVRSTYDGEQDPFSDWIARHDISRADGRWLADRRDPQPAYCGGSREISTAEWLVSIAASDFERVLHPTACWMSVWGEWTKVDADRVESISVYTALVSSERSSALLRALQTTNDPHDYRIPDADDDLQIDHGPHRLKGWILDRPNQSGMDERDDWSGGVRFPAPEPAPFAVEMMRLSTDSDRRVWRTDSATTLKSEAWGQIPERNESERPSGRRLQASVNFVVEFLKTIEMDLVVKVEIQRRSPYQSYETRDSNELRNIGPSARIFIVKGDGTIRSL